MATGWPRRLSRCHLIAAVCLWLAVLEKSEFKDESQYFRFHADEEMEGTSSKNKQLRNDFKLVENILAKRLLVGAQEGCCAFRPCPSAASDSNQSRACSSEHESQD